MICGTVTGNRNRGQNRNSIDQKDVKIVVILGVTIVDCK